MPFLRLATITCVSRCLSPRVTRVCYSSQRLAIKDESYSSTHYDEGDVDDIYEQIFRTSHVAEPQREASPAGFTAEQLRTRQHILGLSYSTKKRLRPAPYRYFFEALVKKVPFVARLYRSPKEQASGRPNFVDAYSDSLQSHRNLKGEAFGQSNERYPDRDEAILDALPKFSSIVARNMEAVVIPLEDERYALRDMWEATEAISSTLTTGELEFLRRRGYDAKDVELWLHILLQASSLKAIRLLQEQLDAGKNIPLFVPSILLNRRRMNANPLQALVSCISRMVQASSTGTHLDDVQMFTIFSRATRNALVSWPEGLESIAQLLSRSLSRAYDPDKPLTPLVNIWLASLFNMALHQVSTQTSIRPVVSTGIQEKAQHELISKMAEFNPPLQLSGRGFQAVTAVQLRQRLSVEEVDWSLLKSRSWPPYRKSQTAMDDDKEFAYGTTKAMRAMQYMRQAGFSFPEWEGVAMIIAGWDHDGKPLIQRRDSPWSHTTRDVEVEVLEWAHRINSTRDVREAWAMLMQFKATELPMHDLIYTIVFKKISGEAKRVALHGPRVGYNDKRLPAGSTTDVVAPAASPRDRVYLTSEPASFNDLFAQYIEECTPRDWALGMILSSSSSAENICTSLDKVIPQLGAKGLEQILVSGEVHEYVVVGTIRGLAESPWSKMPPSAVLPSTTDAISGWLSSLHPSTREEWIQKSAEKSIIHAIHLSKLTEQTDVRLWTQLMNGIVRAQQRFRMPDRPPTMWFLPIVLDMLAAMTRLDVQPNAEFFQHLATFMMFAGRGAIAYANLPTDQAQQQAALVHEASSFLTVGPRLLRRVFAASVHELAQPAAADGVRLAPVNVLRPYACLMYIRALALFGDYEGMYSFARWIAAHEADLSLVAIQEMGGHRRFAYVFATFRLALEQPAALFPTISRILEQQRPSEELAVLIRDTLRGLRLFKGWASDEDVAAQKEHVAVTQPAWEGISAEMHRADQHREN